MGFQKIVINKDIAYECVSISMYSSIFEAVLNTSDCAKVVSDLENIEIIDIYDDTDVLINSTNDYNGYSSITLDMTYRIDKVFVPVVRVAFKKKDLDTLVDELNKKVNNIIDTSAMTLEEYKEYKISQLDKECRAIIEQGLDIETSLGVKHFTYKQDDQFNVKTLFDSARLVKMDVPFHSSKNSCTIYTWQDAIKIYIALEGNLLYHITYCNALFMNIREDLHTKEEVAKVTYGQEVPESRKQDMQSALATGDNLMKAVLKECGITQENIN